MRSLLKGLAVALFGAVVGIGTADALPPPVAAAAVQGPQIGPDDDISAADRAEMNRELLLEAVHNGTFRKFPYGDAGKGRRWQDLRQTFTPLPNDDPFGYMDYANPGAYARAKAR